MATLSQPNTPTSTVPSSMPHSQVPSKQEPIDIDSFPHNAMPSTPLNAAGHLLNHLQVLTSNLPKFVLVAGLEGTTILIWLVRPSMSQIKLYILVYQNDIYGMDCTHFKARYDFINFYLVIWCGCSCDLNTPTLEHSSDLPGTTILHGP